MPQIQWAPWSMSDFYSDYATNFQKAFADAKQLFPMNAEMDKLTPDDVAPFIKGTLSNARDCQKWIFATLSELSRDNELPRREREYRALSRLSSESVAKI